MKRPTSGEFQLLWTFLSLQAVRIALAVAALVAWGHRVFHQECVGLIFWLVVALGFAGLLVWAFNRADKVPDYLSQLGLPSLEREGLCFSFSPALEAGVFEIKVVYQNRYDTPRRAEILLRPEGDAAEAGLKRLRFKLTCEGSGHGTVGLPWAVPQRLQGEGIVCRIGADVDYPDGTGHMVRFMDSEKVGSVRDAEGGPLTEIFKDRPRLELVLPTSVAGTIPPPLPPPLAVTYPEPGSGSLEGSGPPPRRCASALGASPSAASPPSGIVVPSVTTELADERLAELLNSL